MQVISFMNMKGGVGKTTVTVNVAYALAHIHKKKVLVIDGDPQFNATQYLMKENDYIAYIADRKKATLRDIFVPRRPGAVRTVSGSARSADRKKGSAQEFVGRAGIAELGLNSQFADG